ncbi:MAG: serine hydrolase [Actinomycetota bacterium]
MGERRSGRHLRAACCWLLVGLCLGCTSTTVVGPSVESASETGSVSAAATVEPIAAPDRFESARQALETLFAWLDGPAPARADYDRLVGSSALTYEDFLGLRAYLLPGPWTIEGVEVERSTRIAVAASSPHGDSVLWEVSVFRGQIDFYIFQLDPRDPTFDTFDEMLGLLDRYGTVRHLVAPADDCAAAVSESGADDVVPIGSAASLYVAASAIDRVAAGEMAWTDPIELVAEHDTVTPTDPRRVRDDVGDVLELGEVVEDMVRHEDFALMDHLIAHLGRHRIETGRVPPSAQPFLRMDEYLRLTRSVSADIRDEWALADDDRQVALLESDVAASPAVELIDLDARPIEVHAIGWFGSLRDLCELAGPLAFDEVAEPVARFIFLGNSVGPSIRIWDAAESQAIPGLSLAVQVARTEDGDAMVVITHIDGGAAHPGVIASARQMNGARLIAEEVFGVAP